MNKRNTTTPVPNISITENGSRKKTAMRVMPEMNIAIQKPFTLFCKIHIPDAILKEVKNQKMGINQKGSFARSADSSALAKGIKE